MGWVVRDGGTEQKGKRIHEYRQQCGDCWGEAGITGLSNGKTKY